VGYVTPSIAIHTLPLSPYFFYTELKVVLEVLYVLMLLQMIAAEIIDIKERSDSKKDEQYAVLKAIKEHYTGEERVGNLLDMFNIVCGFALCYMWFESVMNLKEVETMLSTLHRPSGQISYDDDSTKWITYHSDVAEINLVVDETIESFVSLQFTYISSLSH
jgi:hypothetical protein